MLTIKTATLIVQLCTVNVGSSKRYHIAYDVEALQAKCHAYYAKCLSNKPFAGNIERCLTERVKKPKNKGQNK